MAKRGHQLHADRRFMPIDHNPGADCFWDRRAGGRCQPPAGLVATPSAIIWVAGLRAAEGYLATPASHRIIMIRVIRNA